MAWSEEGKTPSTHSKNERPPDGYEVQYREVVPLVKSHRLQIRLSDEYCDLHGKKHRIIFNFPQNITACNLQLESALFVT